jgi:hypothetical protein
LARPLGGSAPGISLPYETAKPPAGKRSLRQSRVALNPTFTVSRVRALWTAMSDDPTYLAGLKRAAIKRNALKSLHQKRIRSRFSKAGRGLHPGFGQHLVGNLAPQLAKVRDVGLAVAAGCIALCKRLHKMAAYSNRSFSLLRFA